MIEAMKRTTMMAVLLLIMAGTAVGQVRPFVKAGIQHHVNSS
jgi:hypothetical protein